MWSIYTTLFPCSLKEGARSDAFSWLPAWVHFYLVSDDWDQICAIRRLLFCDLTTSRIRAHVQPNCRVVLPVRLTHVEYSPTAVTAARIQKARFVEDGSSEGVVLTCHEDCELSIRPSGFLTGPISPFLRSRTSRVSSPKPHGIRLQKKPWIAMSSHGSSPGLADSDSCEFKASEL